MSGIAQLLLLIVLLSKKALPEGLALYPMLTVLHTADSVAHTANSFYNFKTVTMSNPEDI